MECTHTKTNKEEFNQKITIFNSRYDLYFFLMNMLLLIQNNGFYYCYWEAKKCQICNINDHFVHFEHDMRKNIFNEHCLKGYHQKLVPYLNQLFHENKNFLCCFLDSEYKYSRETWIVSLSESIKYTEKLKSDEIKRKNHVCIDEK